MPRKKESTSVVAEIKYGPRKGLEGPFTLLSGYVVYYDPKEGKYYDPTTDFYLANDEMLYKRDGIDIR